MYFGRLIPRLRTSRCTVLIVKDLLGSAPSDYENGYCPEVLPNKISLISYSTTQ